jgi:hypothetical protein
MPPPSQLATLAARFPAQSAVLQPHYTKLTEQFTAKYAKAVSDHKSAVEAAAKVRSCVDAGTAPKALQIKVKVSLPASQEAFQNQIEALFRDTQLEAAKLLLQARESIVTLKKDEIDVILAEMSTSLSDLIKAVDPDDGTLPALAESCARETVSNMLRVNKFKANIAAHNAKTKADKAQVEEQIRDAEMEENLRDVSKTVGQVVDAAIAKAVPVAVAKAVKAIQQQQSPTAKQSKKKKKTKQAQPAQDPQVQAPKTSPKQDQSAQSKRKSKKNKKKKKSTTKTSKQKQDQNPKNGKGHGQHRGQGRGPRRSTPPSGSRSRSRSRSSAAQQP